VYWLAYRARAAPAAEAEYRAGVRFQPVTPARREDLERFAAGHGKFRHCSCMRWRMPSGEYTKSSPTRRGAALGDLVAANQPVGVLAYDGDEPVGWCSIAPREQYAAVERSRSISTVDGDRIWAVVCFFIDAGARGTGVQEGLLDAALKYAKRRGARIVEAYPWPGGASYFFMGTPELYEKAGFQAVEVPKGSRPVMRKKL
jgi:GNAT superfamily N-acetyltransferase